MNYYPFHIGDYAAHTQRLSLLEDLAYRRMIDQYMLDERPFNGCSTDVARAIGMMDHLTEVEYVLGKFFTRSELGFSNARCDSEIAHFQDKQSKASSAGKASAERRLKQKATDVEISLTDVQLTKNQEPRTSKEKETTSLVVCVADDEPQVVEIDSKTYRVPDCPYEAIVTAYAQALPALPQVAILSKPRKAHINARWRQVCAAEKFDREQGLDWFRWYFGHVAQSEFLTGRGGGRDTPWRADFEWLLQPGNFVKTIENRYHKDAA